MAVNIVPLGGHRVSAYFERVAPQDIGVTAWLMYVARVLLLYLVVILFKNMQKSGGSQAG